MRSANRRLWRLVPALAAAVVVAGLQAWGWGDAVRALVAGAGWLWRWSWPAVRVAVLPVAAGGALYVATSAAGRRWWRSSPWRAAGRFARRGWVPLAVAGTVVLLAGLMLLAPSWLVAHDAAAGTLTAEQRATATSDARTALLQAVGGLLLAAGAAATWRQVRISREGQVTERFTRAVDQLGSTHLDVRLGALYALERIARDSSGDRRTIAEILTAYIRQRAPWPPTQPGQYRADWPLDEQPDLRTRAPDAQAALTVLGRGPFPRPARRLGADPDRLDLREVDLRKADLDGAHLKRASLGGAHLEGALLVGAHLEEAWLLGAHLEGAQLRGADLQGARLDGADLQGARLDGANLQGASLDRANLQGASLDRANLQEASLFVANLQGARLVLADLQGALLVLADLQGARLDGADLQGASLDDANLQGASLGGANLQGAELGGANLQGARSTEITRWPAGFLWREAGGIEVDLFSIPSRPADQAVVDAAAGPMGPGAAESSEREDPPPDVEQSGLDGGGEPAPARHDG
jgi:uncharacterized protein YjbI with pentapeptide repeats